jgi:hypothetical protein
MKSTKAGVVILCTGVLGWPRRPHCFHQSCPSILRYHVLISSSFARKATRAMCSVTLTSLLGTYVGKDGVAGAPLFTTVSVA